MKQVLLIFLFSVLILLLGILFGFKQIKNPYNVTQSTQELSEPLSIDLDTDFIRKKSF